MYPSFQWTVCTTTKSFPTEIHGSPTKNEIPALSVNVRMENLTAIPYFVLRLRVRMPWQRWASVALNAQVGIFFTFTFY